MTHRVENIRINLNCGRRGHGENVRIKFNGHELTMNRICGGTRGGEGFEGALFVGGPVESCSLLSQTSGPWDLKEIEVEFDCGSEALVRHLFPDCTLEPGEELDLMSPP